MRHAIDADLPFFHRFEQRALRARAGAIDLIGQQQLREHRPGAELELLVAAVEDGDAEDVGRQQVAGELHALPGKAQHLRQRMGQRGLAHARHVLDQQVAAREQAGEREPAALALAEDDRVQARRAAGRLLMGPKVS